MIELFIQWLFCSPNNTMNISPGTVKTDWNFRKYSKYFTNP